MAGYDLTGNWGFGGSTGLLDWGSDIARMWGVGMSTGMTASRAMDDYRYNQIMNPLRMERELMDDQVKREQMQAAYTPLYSQNQADYMAAVMRDPNYRDNYAEQHYGNMNPIRNEIWAQQQQQSPSVQRTQTAITNGNQGASTTNQNTSPTQQSPTKTSYEYDAAKGMILPVYGNQGG